MKKQIQKQMMMLFSALLVLFTILPSLHFEAAEVTSQAKQEFELPFEVMKADTDEKSTAGEFVKSPAKIVVEGENTYAYVTLLQSDFWQSLKVQTTQPGTFKEDNFVDAEVVGEDKQGNTRVVKFKVQDVTEVLNIKAHIIVTGVPGLGEYDHSYDLRIKFDNSQVPEAPEETPEEPETPEVPEVVTPEVMEDGSYTIGVNVLHEEEDKASSMARYIEAPASLIVKDGKNLVAFTLTNNEQITAFQVEQAGEFVDATVVNIDEEANTRVVEFEVADFSKIINAKVQVYVAAANHTGNYVVRLAFDKDSIQAVEVPETPAPEVLQDGAYTIDMNVLHATEDQASSMARYVEAPASLTVKDGKNLVALTLTDNEQITEFQVEQAGEFVDVTVVNIDEEANTRDVEFEVADFSTILNAKVTVHVASLNRTMNHAVRLAFDKESIQAVEAEGTEEIEVPKTPAPTKKEYELAFEILQADKNEQSVAMTYVQSPATIVVEDGKTYAYVTLLNSDWWQSLKVQTKPSGTFVDPEIISENKKENTKVVKFEVQDVKKEVNAKIHIIVKGISGFEYDNYYGIRFKFGSSNSAPGSPVVVPEVTPEKPVIPETPETEVLKDGTYTIDYKALHETEDKASAMAKYIETPAALSVKEGKNLITLTLTNNERITAFQVEQGGKFVDVTVVSKDEEANTRVIEFEVADLTKNINTKVKEFVVAKNGTGNHTVRLAFDKESIQEVISEEPPIEIEETNTFTDIEKSWAKLYIEALASKQIIMGKTPTTFAPNDQITRAQFVLLLFRALELPKQDYEGVFLDVTENMDWIVYEAEAASQAGIIRVNDGKFRPNEKITRQQMAAMIVRAIEYKDASILEGVTSDISFADAAEIAAYAVTPIDLTAGLGIISGKELNGKTVFEPSANATRAHASKMVYYLLEKLEK